MHLVDSVSGNGKGSNQNLQATEDGFFAATLADVPPLAGGQVQLTAYGYTPGGVPVETTQVATAGLGSAPVVGAVLGCPAFAAVEEPRWEPGTGRSRGITGGKLPMRRDELVLHLEQDGRTADLAPDFVAAGRCGFTLPDGFGPGRGSVEVRSLGLVPAPAIPLGF